MSPTHITLDCEVYKNYFLCQVKNSNHKLFTVEVFNDLLLSRKKDLLKLYSILNAGLIPVITYNGDGYDLKILELFFKGGNCIDLYNLSVRIINTNDYIPPSKLNLISYDLSKITAMVSLKTLAARNNCQTIEELPVPFDCIVNEDQRRQLFDYCIHDVDITMELYTAIEDNVQVRLKVGAADGVRTGVYSDTKIARYIIERELKNLGYRLPPKPLVTPLGTFNLAEFLDFKLKNAGDSTMCKAVDFLYKGTFNPVETVTKWGSPTTRYKRVKKLEIIKIGDCSIRLGDGGLHSNRKNLNLKATDTFKILDIDVASYYPNIFLNMQQDLIEGIPIKKVYSDILDKRIKAKQDDDFEFNKIFKIVLNSFYGLTGYEASPFYNPKVRSVVCAHGQIILLDLMVTLSQFSTIQSANTDGITISYDVDNTKRIEKIISKWEKRYNFDMDYTQIRELYAVDVTNYFLVTTENVVKRKGSFKLADLTKNFSFSVIQRAVEAYFLKGVDPDHFIRNHNVNMDFVKLHSSKKPTTSQGKDTGKVLRFYKSTLEGSINVIESGNRVPTSENALIYTGNLHHIDYDYYIMEAKKIILNLTIK